MSERLYVGTRKGLFTVDRNGANWDVTRAAFVGDPVTIVATDPRDGVVYAAVGHGHFGAKLHRSTDGGETFTEVAAPAFPAKPDGVEDLDGSGREWPWSLHQIWALEPGTPEQPGVLWCGTIPGGLFRSDDRGESWRLVEALWNDPNRNKWFGGGADWPGIHSVLVDPRDGNRVVVGVSCGGVWVTDDGGASWDCRAEGMRAAYMPPERAGDPYIQDPHCIVQCPAQPDALWAQHHNGVFRSINRSASWSEIENVVPSTFGFATVVHPRDANTAWFVPGVKDETRIPVDGKVVVARTRDGGATFEVLREGLPQHHAYDITYRHAFDIDGSGDRLAFGSTTGSLWVTENQGDAWKHVSAHLPPVYCVRFDKARAS